MLLVWYTLFNILQLFILFFQTILLKVFQIKKDSISLFNVLLTKIAKCYNIFFINSVKSNELHYLDNSDLQNSIDFKTLYNISRFFNNKNVNNFKDTISFVSILVKTIRSANLLENIKLFFVVNKFGQNLINSKRRTLIVNFNYFVNNAYSYKNFSTLSNKYSKLSSNVNYKAVILNFNEVKNSLVSVEQNFSKKVIKTWIVKYAPSNFIKYINLNNVNTYNILYLRKNKVFNKGRYSRNRQYYRTGVYWCLYINIIAVIGIYYWFYGIAMNFGYLWWLLYAFIASFIIPKAIKYRFYNIKNLINSIINDLIWLSLIVRSLFTTLNNVLIFFKKYFISYFINLSYFSNVNFFKKLNLINNDVKIFLPNLYIFPKNVILIFKSIFLFKNNNLKGVIYPNYTFYSWFILDNSYIVKSNHKVNNFNFNKYFSLFLR